MEEINKNISAKLKGLRAEKGFSLEEMAEKIGVHRETLRKYESNPSSIDSYAKCYCENKASYLYLNGYNNTYILKIYKVWVE